MFTNDDLVVESIESFDPKDLIPYHLTGARVLHKQGYFGASVKVAVVDTGCDFNHDALKDNIKEKNHNFCGYNNSSMDDHGHGCVNGEALIITSNKGIIDIKSFFDSCCGHIIQNDEIALVKDVSGMDIETTSLLDDKIVSRKILNVHKVKVSEELIVVEYKSSKIKFTPWHKVYIQSSSSGKHRRIARKRADQLSEGDRLILNFENVYVRKNFNPRYKNILIDEDFMWFLGTVLTDGHLTKNPKNKRIEISQAEANKELIIKCKEYLDKLLAYGIIKKYSFTETQRSGNYQKTHRVIIYGNDFFDSLMELGIPCGRRDKEIAVPKFVYSLPTNLIHSFLAGLIDGNGCIEKEGKCRIVFQSKRFVDDLYNICFNLGMYCSSMYNGDGNGKSTFGDCKMYALTLGNLEMYPAICNNLSIGRKKQNVNKKRDAYKTVKIKKINKEYFDGYLYDLTVEDTHNYIANGVIVSNTHTASTVVELAPKAEIVPIKVLSPIDGKNSWLINGLEHIASRDDIDVVNMSLSGTLKVGSDDYNRIHKAIKSLVDKNIFVVVASGNTGKESVRYPAYFEEVTTVGAVDVYKHEALFSTESHHVDMCQVGVNLIGAKLGGGYCKMSGTSMATPMVAGIAALLIDKYKSQHDGKRPDGRLIHHMLKLSAIDIGVKGLDKKTGAGFISLDPSAAIIQMTIDEKVYSINGEEHVMDVAPFIKENRSFVPVRYASHEKFVDWDGNTRTITIV